MVKRNIEYKIGVDIGGTKMMAVLFDGGRVVDEYILATPKDNIEHFVIMVNALIEPLLEIVKRDKAKILGIGLGVAGVIDFKSRKVTKSPNIQVIENTDFVKQLENKLALPVFIDNDANCFLRAEVKIGAARKFKNVYAVVIGTGIGSAWWYNDEVYLGSDGAAGEMGHNIIDFKTRTSLEVAYKNLTQGNTLNMSNEAYRGDPLAVKSFEEFGEIFGFTLINMVNILNPEVIVIGGGGAGAEDLFLPETRKTLKEYAHAEEGKKTKILISKLGKQAGAIGAAMLVK